MFYVSYIFFTRKRRHGEALLSSVALEPFLVPFKFRACMFAVMGCLVDNVHFTIRQPLIVQPFSVAFASAMKDSTNGRTVQRVEIWRHEVAWTSLQTCFRARVGSKVASCRPKGPRQRDNGPTQSSVPVLEDDAVDDIEFDLRECDGNQFNLEAALSELMEIDEHEPDSDGSGDEEALHQPESDAQYAD